MSSHSTNFSGDEATLWVKACRKLEQAGYGPSVAAEYVRYSPKISQLINPKQAISLADDVSFVAIRSGVLAAESLPAAAVNAAERLNKDAIKFRLWLGLIVQLATLAPESVLAVLKQTDRLLSHLSVDHLEAWILAGLRAYGTNPEQRLGFFNFTDPEAGRWFDRESGSVLFTDIDRRLKAYMRALWGIHIPIRPPPLNASEQARRRASFGMGVIRIPSAFPGFRWAKAEDLFHAVLAHIGAHKLYSGKRFPVRKLKQIQIALISLIEDARVEHLAMRDFPGLKRLWLPFHVAQAAGITSAPNLLARLSRALIDPEYSDSDSWVLKGKDLFFSRQGEWDSPQISRQIGGLLGNDIGQMRVQFNAKTYVVEPAYRDDNLGLWEFDDLETAEMEESELLLDSVRIIEEEDGDDQTNSISLQLLEVEGMPVAHYPEYDYVTGKERSEWTTVVEYLPPPGPAHLIDDILEMHAPVVNRITALISSARVSRPQKMRRQHEGDFLDIDACIDATISYRRGENPNPRIYGCYARKHRDLSVLLLLDISQSTQDKVVGANVTVLDLEREATALVAHAISGLGDPFAIAAFSSNGRKDIRYHRIKDFGSPYEAMTKSFLAGLTSGYSTRIGTAMRHAAADLKRQSTHRRLLLVVTDGEPFDIDITDKKYLIEDARHVIHDLAQDGIDVFCVGLDSGGDSYLTRIFGRKNVVQIDKLERLPERLPMLYFRLIA
jgi:hypothetical protein